MISGVPLQPLPNTPTPDRDCSRLVLVRTPDQDLVPEPADEVQEGQQAAQHQERPPEDQPRRGYHYNSAQVHGGRRATQQ